MKKMIKISLLLLFSGPLLAVNLNPDGFGQAVILPYYTVNNDLNTLVSINNSTDSVKAVKVHFREGRNGNSVLSFNLYLAPQDIWAFALVEGTSNTIGHEGEPGAQILFNDQSCTPFLTSGQAFLPFEFDTEAEASSMQRAREGTIEIFEMGELNPDTGFGQDITFANGIPRNCAAIEANWVVNGAWDDSTGGNMNEQILPATGGLSASASIINVSGGIDFSFDGTAIEHFYPENTSTHSNPGTTTSPSLASADKQSTIIQNGQIISSLWNTGFEAVSALLIKEQIHNEFALDEAINAQTEWVVSFPTKRFYTNTDTPLIPFTSNYSGASLGSCESYTSTSYDRESNGANLCELNPNNELCAGGGILLPPSLLPSPSQFCWVSNVVRFSSDFTDLGESTLVLGSQNINISSSELDPPVTFVPIIGNGKHIISFNNQTDMGNDPSTNNTHTYTGLPIIGFAVQAYTNSNAQPGLLAKYGGLFTHKFKTSIEIEN